MKKIFFIYETLNYEKHYLFEYPITKDLYSYLRYRYNELKKSFINKSNDNDRFVEKKNLLHTFLINHKHQKPFSLDLIIDNLHYISYPTKINQQYYYKEKINKNNYNKIYLFNLVFVLDKNETLKKNSNLINNLYLNLQCFSKYLQFEEYTKNYLNNQIKDILKNYDKLFREKNSNEEKLYLYIKNNNLFKNIENIFKSIEKKTVTNFEINNKTFNFFFDIKFKDNLIKPYHSIILIKKKYEEILLNNSNPNLLIFLNNCKPDKTIQEICLEKNIDLNLILIFVNNLINWNCAIKIFKIQNNSIFITNHNNINYDLNKNIEKEKKDKIFKIMEKLTLIEPYFYFEDFYKTHFSDSIYNEEFLEYIIFILENEFIVMVSQILISKLKFKYEYKYENMIIQNFNEISNNLIALGDNNNENKNEIENKEINENEIYYENFLKEIEKIDKEEYKILYNIMPFVQKKMFIDEICYFTGYKMNTILEKAKKYNYIFNILVLPINNNE
jgi:hypothetical protein